VVARAIRACPIPVVSGVGHETDFTITDFAADRRAPTPTAAAELTSPDRVALLHRVEMMAHRLSQRTLRDVQGRMQRLDAASRRLEHPGQRLQAQLDRLRQLRERLGRSMDDCLSDMGWRLAGLLHRGRALLPAPAEQRAHVSALATRLRIAMDATVGTGGLRLASLATSLEHLNPERVLERGYSLVRDASGKVVTRGDALSPGDALDIRFAQGGAKVRVDQSH
jgi:exodeoxyribonuclease VII large subunit